MNNLFVHIFTLLFLLLQGKTTSDMIGRWQGLEKSPEGLRRVLQLDPDGSFTSIEGATFKGTYKLHGHRLVTNTSQTDSKVKTNTQRISIKGNALILELKGMQWKGIRSSPRVPDSPPIVGRWQFEFPGLHGGRAGLWEFEFSKNGEVISRIELYPQKGHYEIEGDLIVMTVDKETYTCKFCLEDGFLCFPSLPLAYQISGCVSVT